MSEKILSTTSDEGVTYIAYCRCDWEEYFCTEELEFTIDTNSLAEAALFAEKHFSHYTLLEIKKKYY